MKTALLILMLAPLFASSQCLDKNGKDLRFSGYGIVQYSDVYRPRFDTIKVIMLVSDTTHYYWESMEFQTCKEVGCPDSIKHRINIFVSHYKTVKNEIGSIEKPSYLKLGFEVRSVGYAIDLKYLDSSKKPIKPEIIVWMSKLIKN